MATFTGEVFTFDITDIPVNGFAATLFNLNLTAAPQPRVGQIWPRGNW